MHSLANDNRPAKVGKGRQSKIQAGGMHRRRSKRSSYGC